MAAILKRLNIYCLNSYLIVVLLTCTYVPISSLVHKIALFLSRKIRYIGYYLNRPPFRNDSMDQHNLKILLLYLYYQII